MNFLSFIGRYKLSIHYLTIVILLAGALILTNMQREARPNVNFNRVNITARYLGASPSDIEQLIIDPIEEKVAEVDGLEEYRSVSHIGAGSISIRIDDSYPNPEKITDEIRRKVTEVSNLPLEVDDPIVSELKATNIPVLNLALYGTVDPFTLKLETEKLKDFLQLQEGVQSVSYSGLSDLQFKILADPEKLNRFDITLDEILKKLSDWARSKPGGLFENDSLVANLTIGEDLSGLDALNNFVVRSNDSGQKIKLSDIAKVKFDLESMQTGNIFEDHEAVLFTVVKKPFYDSIKVVDHLNEALQKYRQGLADKGLSIRPYKDQSIRIRNKLRIVVSNALTGLVLVLIILVIFLDWRSSIVTSIGIPVAILGGICILYFMGQTMNSLVVVGMIIVLGMLVDDAIVVCENIYSYLEKGLSPVKAAIKGTTEIALPVVASVLTTIFAFLPIVFMKEIIGQFLRVIPITVIALLGISLFEALVILPIHAKEIMKVGKKNDKKKRLFYKFEQRYQKYLHWSLTKRWFLLAALLVFFIFSGFQGKKIFERFSLFPAEGLEGLNIRIELPRNTPLPQTKSVVKELSQKLILISEKTFDNIYSTVGQVVTGGSLGSRQNGAHLARINISFTSDPDFIYKEKRIVKKIRQTVGKFTKNHDHKVKASITLHRPGPPIGRPIQFQITSRDFSFGQSVVEMIKGELGKIKGVHSLETDLDGDSIKYRLKINNELAVSEGIDPQKISRTIFAASTGKVANEILKNNEKIEILLTIEQIKENRKEKGKESSVKEILKLKVRNSHGQAVAVGPFVEIIKEKGPSSIQRLNGLRTITLFGEVEEKIITGKQVNARIKPYINELRKKYQTITIATGGGEKDRLNAVKDTMKLYGLAIILIFMAISLTFQSVFYPLLVLTAIPMGLSGVVWSLFFHGKSLSIMGIIGIVGLSGVVVNVSIIFLKFIQDKLKRGLPFREAIIESGVTRLRPIIMTTLSTLIGLLPTIYGIGGIDTFVQPIALVLGWGLFVATTLTLLFLPAMISFFPFLEKK